jgi:hypothetical protein
MENQAMIIFGIRRGEALATTMFESPPKFILANASPCAHFYLVVCWRKPGRSMTQFKLSVIPEIVCGG